MRSERWRKKNIRLSGRDYTKAAWYFVTIRMAQGPRRFGKVENGRMILSALGREVDTCWRAIPEHMHGWALDDFVVMPDHFHGIVYGVVGDGGMCGKARGKAAGSAAATRDGMADVRDGMAGVARATLGVVICQFKTVVSKIARDRYDIPSGMLWQNGYHERVIRDGTIEGYRHYIAMNPVRWKSHPNARLDARVAAADPAALPTPAYG
jgi:REP element-mobilizing transposase RayT